MKPSPSIPAGPSVQLDAAARLEFKQLRAAARRQVNGKLRRIGFRSVDQWLKHADSIGLTEIPLADRGLIMGIFGASLPSLGSWWTGLIVVDHSFKTGHAWFNAVDGATTTWRPPALPIALAEGDAPLRRIDLDGLSKILSGGPLSRFQHVPSPGYDGAPVRMQIRTGTGEVDCSANVCDSGSQPALRLAKRVWSIWQSVTMVETRRCIPKVRPLGLTDPSPTA